MKEYFPNVPRIEYQGKGGSPFSFKFYNPDEMLCGKAMKEHLRFAMSYWHTLCGDALDLFGPGTLDRSFGGTNDLEIYTHRAYAGFEFMNKLGIDLYCFHDRDIAPEGKTLTETNALLDKYVDLLEKLMEDNGKKLLWGTTNVFRNKRYMHGAATSCNADVFAYAAAQIKKMIEVTTRLNGQGYVFWGGREGYVTLLNTDFGLEQDNYASMLTMARDYARSIGFTGDLYIEPKPMEPMKHQYDYDVSTVLAFLRKYGLQDDFKMNIEANHATLARHSFAHELRVARENGVFGSIDANQGEIFNGWDTDNFPSNVYDIALAMYEVIKAGGFTNGGTNFDAKLRRESVGPNDLFHAYILGMDAMALGYKMAWKLVEDGRIDQFINKRYISYDTGIGVKIRNGNTSFKELEQYALALGDVSEMESGCQEYLEGIVNEVFFG